MVERLKDKEDRMLEAMFSAEPIADDGFSVRVVSKVRQRMWFRRLAMPVALLIGGAVSIGPFMELLAVLPGLVNSLFGASLSLDRLPIDALPQASTILLGGSLAMALMLASKLLEE